MTITTIICRIVVVLGQVEALLFIVATVVFSWGAIQYVIAGGAGDEKKLAAAKNYIIYGLVGLFAMLAMWGITFAIYRTILGENPSIPIPSPSSCQELNPPVST
ncbi:hypothetical protein A2661_00980 [Candidatus Giovannonibacteria bacterium RIFCSPHIGHO2_01_FULL_45_24]|uniref:Uncharacterized protein n=1 Tax=Candidatus Giovannonibacteria bacterium RIFCSPLOWO2_01_FULL_46_32 TaxID=1798353 RepID=A0A1F5XGH1_9BACT|nr:MAG: hypothetical protein A2661_00980 [Candidatus Giovannonibacteria bacterium RIFCSPHIGHO2_01_FULL_45_24]OGF86591.1 MAG: hypothetical protein A3B19_00055 [Candidatus Giovannonibacteria bacterium RIFCSPLOWO2_01_FULL_46_32]